MPEPLTKVERGFARGYAEGLYANATDSQEHAVAVMILRLLDTVAALEATVARLTPLAETGKAVEGMPESCALVRKNDYWAGYWVLSIEATEYNECNARVGDMTGWYEKPSGALDVLADYGAPPQAALAAAKGEGDA